MDEKEILQAIARLDEALRGLQSQVSGALSRIDEGAKRESLLHEINRKLDVLQANTEQRLLRLEDRVTQHGKEIDELRLKPAKRWESAVMAIITGAIAVIVTYLATRAGLK